MKINKKLLKELKEGKIAIDYTEKSEEGLKRLNQIIETGLKKSVKLKGGNQYYMMSNDYWIANDSNRLPKVKLNDFFVYTLEDLTNGVVVLEYDGESLEDLKNVLSHCFVSVVRVRGDCEYYRKSIFLNEWKGNINNDNNLPTQKLSVFMEELNELTKEDSKPELVQSKKYNVWNYDTKRPLQRIFALNYKNVNYFESTICADKQLVAWDNYEEIKTKFTIELEVEAESKEEAIIKIDNSITLWDGIEIKIR